MVIYDYTTISTTYNWSRQTSRGNIIVLIGITRIRRSLL